MVIIDTGGHMVWGSGSLALGITLWIAGRHSMRALNWGLLTATIAYGWIAYAHLSAWEKAREAIAWT